MMVCTCWREWVCVVETQRLYQCERVSNESRLRNCRQHELVLGLA